MTIGIFILIIFLSFFAGWRLIGIDRENYISMYNGVINSETFALKIYFAKDFFYLLFTQLINIFSDDPRYVFFTIIFLSFILKFQLLQTIKLNNLFLSFLLYIIFLSSVLEFIAFRSALSLSFLLFAILNRNRSRVYLFLFLSILSHTSSILPAFCISPIFSNLVNKSKLNYLLLLIFPIFFSSDILIFFPQGESYVLNQEGTSRAIILPLVTLLSAFLIFYKFNKHLINNHNDNSLNFIHNSKFVIFSLIYFSIGITPFVVTAATRYLEFVYLLLLIAGITMYKKSYVNFLGFLLLLIILFYLNIVKELWINIFYPIN